MPNSKKQDITLNLLAFSGLSYLSTLQTLADDFYAQKGVRVQITTIPHIYGWWYLLPTIKADLASSTPQYDMFLDDHEFEYVLEPHLVELSPFIQASGYDTSGFLNPFYKYNALRARGESVRYSLPVRARVPYIFYRTDLISEFPTTWQAYDEMLQANTTGKRFGLGVVGTTYPEPFARYEEWSKHFFARYWSLGDPLFTPDWKPLINSDKGVAALEMFKRQISNYAPPDVSEWDGPKAVEAFFKGEIATLETTANNILFYLQAHPEFATTQNWSVGAYPGRGAAFFKAHSIMLFKHSKHLQEAFEFMAFCTSAGAAARINRDPGSFTARKTVARSPEGLAKHPNVAPMIERLERGTAFVPGLPQWLNLWRAHWEALAVYMLGQAPAQQALDRAARKWNQIIEQAKPDWEYQE